MREKKVGWLKSILAIWLCFALPILLTAAVTQIDLTINVRGVLPTANGGTGQNSSATFPASGTLMTTTTGVAAGQLPNPSASTLGGVESITSASHQWISYIDTSGVPHQSQPAYSDLSGSAAPPTFYQEVPSGTVNGSNVTFTLAHTPTAAVNVNCFENGLQQQQGAGNDYTISSATITYLTAPPTNTKIVCSYS